MLRSLLSVDLLHCNAVLDALQQGQEWQKALQMLESMRVIGLAPDTASVNTVMGACLKGQQRSAVLRLLYGMPGEQLLPDTISTWAKKGWAGAPRLQPGYDGLRVARGPSAAAVHDHCAGRRL